MAGADSEVVILDLLDDIVLDKSTNLLDTLTEEEREEVENVVTLLDCAKEDSLQHFELTDESDSTGRHKNINEEELDRLAGKNSAASTSYQTKWVVCVMKDECYSLFPQILHKT